MSMPALRHFLLFSVFIFQGTCYAISDNERQQLSLIQRQLDTMEFLSTGARTASQSAPDERYRFDYPQLIQDIQRIRQGVQGYLSPTRAQPRDPTELVGDYRLDTPSAELSP